MESNLILDCTDSLRTLGLSLLPIQKLHETCPDILQDVVKNKGHPMIFRGLIEHWPVAQWTPDYLLKKYGEKSIKALVNLPSSGVFFPKDQKLYERQLLLSEFLNLILTTPASKPCYLAYQRNSDLFSSEQHDFDEILGALNIQTDTRIWIGSSGTRSMLHSDLKDNLFYQVIGRKSVILVPWKQSVCVYPCPNNIVNSQLDLANLNLELHPKVKKATLYAATMEPGDMLFIPKGWWHDIRSLTPSISLNHWFGLPLNFRDYTALIWKLGVPCWQAIAKDFYHKGMLKKPEKTDFFFSPATTGKRLYDLLRWGNFSKDNDPVEKEITE